MNKLILLISIVSLASCLAYEADDASDLLDSIEIERIDGGSYYEQGALERGYGILSRDEHTIVIDIWLGRRNTGGFGLEIIGIHLIEDDIFLPVIENTPRDGEMVTQALTYPWARYEITTSLSFANVDRVEAVFRQE